MAEDSYKEYKLWQKKLSIKYQNKLEPMWNRLITFNNKEYGNIGFFLYKFEIKGSERGKGYGTKIIKEILDNNICNYLVIKNIADNNSLRFWNRIRDNIDYYILPNSNKIRKNILKLCKRNEWWNNEWNKDNILIITSKNNELFRCSKYNGTSLLDRYNDPNKNNGMQDYQKKKKQSKRCRKNQCWYNYKSKKCLPHFKKLTMEDPFYIEAPKSMSNDSQDSFFIDNFDYK